MENITTLQTCRFNYDDKVRFIEGRNKGKTGIVIGVNRNTGEIAVGSTEAPFLTIKNEFKSRVKVDQSWLELVGNGTLAPVIKLSDFRKYETSEQDSEGVKQIRKNMKAWDLKQKRLNSARQNENNRARRNS